jgi:hypothetical protein
VRKSNAFEWHEQSKEGRENVEDDEGSGRPGSHRTNENFDNVEHSDRRF